MKRYIDGNNDFEFPKFLYDTINNLMKMTLDLGTLACTNPAQLRAFKETVKKNFKTQWQEVAEMLESYEIISACVCNGKDYCTICGGSRFVTNDIFKYDELEESNFFFGTLGDENLREKLRAGHQKAIVEAKRFLDEGN